MYTRHDEAIFAAKIICKRRSLITPLRVLFSLSTAPNFVNRLLVKQILDAFNDALKPLHQKNGEIEDVPVTYHMSRVSIMGPFSRLDSVDGGDINERATCSQRCTPAWGPRMPIDSKIVVATVRLRHLSELTTYLKISFVRRSRSTKKTETSPS